ncbi:DUF5693 family protein [Desulfofundulus thermosubterraneus]|uniref:Uncharacterized protein n=1 Tax=Desulfofundulus thermosubterraneus DSM 16057 TaxID=1121432 RepID=A0A1M6I145_9FIRM|nr:DUF5693 family protein [Desulfofundulus thermosubterraneus]SHJ28115.1 hypothetical protein SAMN02745219_02174 [Desulfofundulus thermosubterraneus DSM 16057]
MRQRWYPLLLVFLLLAGVIAAGAAAWQRYRVEAGFRTVEVAMPYEDLNTLARLSGRDTLEVMRLFRERGLTTVLFKEPTADELRRAGEIAVMTGQELQLMSPPWLGQLRRGGGIATQDTYLVTSREETFRHLLAQLRAKTSGAQGYRPAPGIYVVRTPADPGLLSQLGLGFPDGPLQDTARAGLLAMVQVRSWPGATARGIEQALAPLKEIPNLSVLAFNDDTLPGYPQKLRALAQVVDQLGVPVAQIEFFPQKGLEQLGLLLDKDVVRLHSIPPRDMGRYTPAEALERYRLAAAERNMRVLLVRPFPGAGARDVLQENLDYISSLKESLQQEGLVVGQASTLPALPVSRANLFVMGLGVIAGGLLLAGRLGLRRGEIWLLLLAVAAWAGLLAAAPSPARKLMALAAVIIFPSLAIITNVRARGAPALESAGMLLRTTLASLLGALFTVGLLTDAGFMLKLDQFSGVKLAHLAPLLLVAGVFFFLSGPAEPFGKRLERTLNQPVLVKWAALAALLLAVLAVYLVRTGNEGQMATSALELKFRGFLDAVLGVRPRTKEFLLGHPALMLLFYTGYRDNRFLPLLLLGAIGQVSLVNTFAHIHTPLLVSLMRLVNGLWLGILVGLAAILVVNLAQHWWRRFSPGDSQ